MGAVVRATQTEIEKAVETLRAGDLVVFPTETVYGLGANASNPAAVRKIFEVKGRPADHPVIVHLDDQRYLHRWVSECRRPAERLAAMFWPGPLTLILPKARQRQRHRHRRAEQHRHPHSLASHGAAAVDRVRRRHRRAVRQSLRPLEPDQARARARRARRRGARDARRRRLADRSRVDHRVVPRQRGAPAAAGLHHALADSSRSSANSPVGGAAPRVPGDRAQHYAPSTPLEIVAVGRSGSARRRDSWRATRRWPCSRCARRCTRSAT